MPLVAQAKRLVGAERAERVGSDGRNDASRNAGERRIAAGAGSGSHKEEALPDSIVSNHKITSADLDQGGNARNPSEITFTSSRTLTSVRRSRANTFSKAPNPRWWGILATLPWWVRWSATILTFIVGTAIGLVLGSVVYLRIMAP